MKERFVNWYSKLSVSMRVFVKVLTICSTTVIWGLAITYVKIDTLWDFLLFWGMMFVVFTAVSYLYSADLNVIIKKRKEEWNVRRREGGITIVGEVAEEEEPTSGQVTGVAEVPEHIIKLFVPEMKEPTVVMEQDEYNPEESEYGREELAQYYLDRDRFCEIVLSMFNFDIDSENLQLICIDGFTGNRFHLFYDCDDFYILDMKTGMMINWYKNLGRINTCNQSRTEEEIIEFFKLLKVDLKENYE